MTAGDEMEATATGVNDALDRLDGDRDLLFELYDVFLTDKDEQLKNLRDAVTARDLKKIEEISHSMKSALANIGAAAASSICLKLEVAGRNNDLGFDFGGNYAALAPSFDLYARYIESIRGGS